MKVKRLTKLAIIGALLWWPILAPTTASAASSGHLTIWTSAGGSFSLANNQFSFAPNPSSAIAIAGLNASPDHIHIFTVDNANDLRDLFGQVNGSFSLVDVSAQTGATVVPGVGATLYGGNSVQIFALSATNDHLLSFVGVGDSGPYNVYDLSANSGSSAVLNTRPSVLAVGSAVHVYVGDTSDHLHDFFKSPSANWQDIDLTAQTGTKALFGKPYAYGQSVQTAAISPSGDLLSFVQGVNSDGTLNGSSSVYDLTQLSGSGEQLTSAPTPIVVASNPTVVIFGDDRNGHLVGFAKNPDTQWLAFTVANLGETNQEPAAYIANSNSQATNVHVVSVNVNGDMIDYSGFNFNPNPPSLAGLGGSTFPKSSGLNDVGDRKSVV